MAGPYTHYLLADQYADSHDTDRALFVAGSLLPDIRYLGVVGRQASHPDVSLLSQVTSTDDPLWAGVLYHAYVDHVTEQIRHDAYDLACLHSYPLASVALKIAEDRFFASFSGSKNEAKHLLTTPSTNPFGVAQTDVERWYELTRTILNDFTETKLRQYLVALSFRETEADEVIRLSHDEDVVRAVAVYTPHFNSFI
ncbi:MAG TPA: hypothetical protein VF597_01835 [Candidatus Saccharimonadales bacterium]|jgi:hypothetical protein